MVGELAGEHMTEADAHVIVLVGVAEVRQLGGMRRGGACLVTGRGRGRGREG